jgi:hypothetical protein
MRISRGFGEAPALSTNASSRPDESFFLSFQEYYLATSGGLALKHWVRKLHRADFLLLPQSTPPRHDPATYVYLIGLGYGDA